MLTRKSLLMAMAVVANSMLFAANQLSAQTQCTGGQYTVTAQQNFLDGAGNKVWKFTVLASQTALNSVKDFVAIIHRPVTPQDIVFPTPLRTYCDQADTNTKLNRGNCDGFPLSVPLVKVGSSLVATIITSPRVTEGLITANVVSGSATADTCVSFVNNVPTGIVGPGEVGDPFQPVFQEQQALVAGGKCLAKLIFDNKGQLTDIESLTPECIVGSPVGDLLVNGAPLKNNTSPNGITFGNGTSTCYGPPVPSPARCICTRAPCP